ncbi:MAG: hypothetical protein FJ147_19235 [Deltaproteobacteria bacterium]|nr:hypothetical protein [Deltaproteobacteria bacterium]
MSTKATIVYGPTFHFYHEVFGDDAVYLELEGVQFEAGYNRVMVPIPVHIWEVIRQYPGVDLSFAERTDAELAQFVEQEVEERMRLYQQASENAKGLVSLCGALVYGSADEPREQQIARGLEHFATMRAHQRPIQAAIAELEQQNKRKCG